jgi:hypothetical protein
MRSNRLTVKSLAIVLLLIFCQKAGGGLYLHNWLHANNCREAQSTGANVTGYNCSCIDDFSMPFAENSEVIVQTISYTEAEFISFYKFLLPLTPALFNSQRGPPFFS